MLFGRTTTDFDHLQYLPLIERMYENNSLDEIKNYASFSQVDRFRKELDTLDYFNLHKKIDFQVDRSREKATEASLYRDGKVDTIFSVSNAKIIETYKDGNNKRHHKRKIKHSFLQSISIKSNKKLTYEDKNPPHCMNCGGQMEAEGENYFCPYCKSKYKAEAYKYLMARFFVENAFAKIKYLWYAVIAALAMGIFLHIGLINKEKWDDFLLYFSHIAAIILTSLFIFKLVKELRRHFKSISIIKKLRRHDPNFSKEIFTSRLNDLLALNPESLLADSKEEEYKRGIIFRNILNLQFDNYQLKNNLEELECSGRADTLYIEDRHGRLKVKDKDINFTVKLSRSYGTLTAVHYLPEQFTCPNCGSHQFMEDSASQICSYCQSTFSMESLDWGLS